MSKASKEVVFYWGRKITENAAIASFDFIGRCDDLGADKVSVNSIRETITESPLSGRVVSSEGEKDKSYYLRPNEDFGKSSEEFDFIIDPIEGTSNLSKGLYNSLSVLCICDRKTVLPVGPSFYTHKFMAPPETKGKIDIEAPLKDKVIAVSKILGKPLDSLGVFVLDKPRHAEIVQELLALGVRVHLSGSCDVIGGLYVASSRPGIDMVIGTGGTPEGILMAGIAKAMNLEYYFRYNPQKEEEKVRMKGYDLKKWWSADEIISSKDVYFFATAITHTSFLNQIKKTDAGFETETLVISNIDKSIRKVVGSYAF